MRAILESSFLSSQCGQIEEFKITKTRTTIIFRGLHPNPFWMPLIFNVFFPLKFTNNTPHFVTKGRCELRTWTQSWWRSELNSLKGNLNQHLMTCWDKNLLRRSKIIFFDWKRHIESLKYFFCSPFSFMPCTLRTRPLSTSLILRFKTHWVSQGSPTDLRTPQKNSKWISSLQPPFIHSHKNKTIINKETGGMHWCFSTYPKTMQRFRSCFSS